MRFYCKLIFLLLIVRGHGIQFQEAPPQEVVPVIAVDDAGNNIVDSLEDVVDVVAHHVEAEADDGDGHEVDNVGDGQNGMEVEDGHEDDDDEDVLMDMDYDVDQARREEEGIRGIDAWLTRYGLRWWRVIIRNEQFWDIEDLVMLDMVGLERIGMHFRYF